ncbi:MAG: hypothetical protein LBI12_02045 [Treponema sp.]|jgi:hypothetical protein|nr:hypothetical protein [Treponema sp.]
MDMGSRKVIKTLFSLVIIVFWGGCDAMDSFLPSVGTYKINALVNDIPLDECSFIGSNKALRPYFEESVSNDPDVTALVVFLRNSRGEIIGQRVVYSLENDGFEANETVVLVKNLDDVLPAFPLPVNLSIGRYIMVSQVMRGKDILQRSERAFFYLGNTDFSYEGINVHLPGITENTQVIPRGMVVMLEAKLNFDSRLDPYIVWYNGRRKISEGKYSDGAGLLLWKAQEQSGFYNIRAEVYPVENYFGLAGYQKEISLLVSSKTLDTHLVSEDIPQLFHWYLFEGDLNDSKMAASAERALKPAANNRPQWMPANGSFGLATGYNNVVMLPKVSVSNAAETSAVDSGKWQTLFRFKPVNDGEIFSVLFESSPDISMVVEKENRNLVLRLISPAKTVSQVITLPEQVSFITAGVNFSIVSGKLSAKINIMGDSVEQGQLAAEPIYLEVEIENNFQILLGIKPEETLSGGSVIRNKPAVTAIWDEFALYNAPPMEIIESEVKQAGNKRYFDSSVDSFY